MYNKIFTAVFFSFLNVCFAQGYQMQYSSSVPKQQTNEGKSYRVTYNLIMKIKQYDINTDITTVLEGNKNKSVYVENFSKNTTTSSSAELINIDANTFFYKDHLTKKIVYSDHIKFKFFVIEDEIKSFDWILLPETKLISGYLCQKANCVFRGREYFVFFTKEIPTSDGPWKFGGLPGLILEVFSDDAVALYSINFKSIVYVDDSKIVDKFEGKKTVSYDEFKSMYNKRYQQSLVDVVNDRGETRPMPKGFIEMLVD